MTLSGTLRISATLLESFRLFLQEDWFEEASLLASIKGETVPTRNMQLGTAYHAILERPDRHRMLWGGYESGEFRFADSAVEPMLEWIDRRGTFEVKTTKQLDNVTLVAQADHIAGAHLSEFKTTLEGFDAEKYCASYQWRVMALLFEPLAITYRVACLSDDEPIGLRSLENLTVYPYATLEADCRALVREFVSYLKLRKLDGLLKERQLSAEMGR